MQQNRRPRPGLRPRPMLRQQPTPVPHMLVPAPNMGQLPGLDIMPPAGQTLGQGQCLGTHSREHLNHLQYLLEQELSVRGSLLALADSKREWKNILLSVADDSLYDARRLASAHQLISVQGYWPSTIPCVSGKGVPLVELERLYNVFTYMENEYRLAVTNTDDSCLAALYEILADAKLLQAGSLLSLLQMY